MGKPNHVKYEVCGLLIARVRDLGVPNALNKSGYGTKNPSSEPWCLDALLLRFLPAVGSKIKFRAEIAQVPYPGRKLAEKTLSPLPWPLSSGKMLKSFTLAANYRTKAQRCPKQQRHVRDNRFPLRLSDAGKSTRSVLDKGLASSVA